MRQTDLRKAGWGRVCALAKPWRVRRSPWQYCGVSGAIQLAGREDSKISVAITRDEEASLFQVRDLFRAVPALIAKLDAPK